MALDVPAVLQLSRDLQRATSVPDLLVVTQDAIRQATAYRNVWLAGIEPGEPRMVRILAVSGRIEPLLWERAPRFPVDGDVMLEEICASVKPVVVEDARTDPRTDKAMVERLGNRTLINVPLMIGDERLGSLGIGTFAPEAPRPPSAAELELLVVFATQVAAAFQRVQMVEAQRALERRLQAIQRVEVLALLAGGVAHDFNNLLTVILSGLDFAEDHATSPLQKADLSEIRDAAVRATQLTRQLLAMGRRQTLQLEPLDLGRQLGSVQKLIRRLLPESISIELDVPPDLPRILVDPPQLDQVVLNLCVNARDAMPDGGRLVLRCAPVELTAGQLGPRARARPGRFVRLDVADTGHGMPPEVQERILEPFFTTKPQGKGTGLGLAVASGIIDQHGGLLECTSAVGAGTTFSVYFPVADGPGVPVRTRGVVAAAARDAERVLIAEDDPAVRDIERRILSQVGYQVMAVGDGLAAIQAAAAERFDLVILDAVMPGTNGEVAWRRIREAKPGTRFLLVSGHASEAFPPELLQQAALPLLPKPFTQAALLAAVRRALDAPAA